MKPYSEVFESVSDYLSSRDIELDEETLHAVITATIIYLGFDLKTKEELN